MEEVPVIITLDHTWMYGWFLGMRRYHNFISDTDSDTPFSVSADTEYRSDTADTEYQSDTFPKIC